MAPNTPSIALCADNTANLDKDFFESLGAQVVLFASPEELLEHLKTTRPHGVCVVFGVQALVSRPEWLLELERRAFFEGLRVVAFVRAHGGGITSNELFSHSSSEALRTRFSPVLAFRDVILYEFPLTARERRMLRTRVALSLGLAQGPVHDEKISLLVKRAGRVRIALPGRASWIANDKSICVECSVRPKLNSFCTLRFIDGWQNVFELHAICKDVSSTNLRFNYGSKVRLGLSDADFLRFVEYFKREDQRSLSRARPIRRALVIIRNPALRDRVVEALRQRHVEVRLPLVWKNVKLDVPRMNPHFLLVEDEILLRNPERTDGLLREMKTVIQSETELCVVGARAESLGALDSSLRLFSQPMHIERDLADYLERILARRPDEEDKQRIWISSQSSVADCLVEVEDQFVFSGTNGIVVEGPHSYRSLCNAVLDFANGEARLLAKNTGSYLSTDLWKLPPSGSPQDVGNLSLFYFTFLQPSDSYAREFNYALRLETDAFQHLHPFPMESSAPTSVAQPELGEPLVEDEGDELWRRAQSPRPVVRVRKKPPKKMGRESIILVAAIFIIMATLIAVAVLQPQSESPFTHSFQQLFEQRSGEGK